ncbi:MAG: hypothetical protein FGM54_09820 [Chitinophagaceae bacterium]|nr:hypothetical protein [Chitinophagaceae bacterium]
MCNTIGANVKAQTIQNNTQLLSLIKGNKPGPALDKLAQLRKALQVTRPGGPTKCPETLVKRAQSKYLNTHLDKELRKLNKSPLFKAYWNTFYCAFSIIQEGKKTTSRYCKNRWCMVCNRIRTAQLINGYLEPLSELQEPYFVTLTRPTCTGERLEAVINENVSAFRRIQDKLRKQGRMLSGVRKLECTTRPHGQYHPHFHIIVDTKQGAELLISEWLNAFPESNRKGQDMKEATPGSIKELMKYFTKIFSTKKGKEPNAKVIQEKVDVRRLDVIFQAMAGKRVCQPFGTIKKQVPAKVEDIETIQAEEHEFIETSNGQYMWVPAVHDYVNIDTGELLTGYKPSKKDVRNVQSIMNIGQYDPG